MIEPDSTASSKFNSFFSALKCNLLNKCLTNVYFKFVLNDVPTRSIIFGKGPLKRTVFCHVTCNSIRSLNLLNLPSIF